MRFFPFARFFIHVNIVERLSRRFFPSVTISCPTHDEFVPRTETLATTVRPSSVQAPSALLPPSLPCVTSGAF